MNRVVYPFFSYKLEYVKKGLYYRRLFKTFLLISVVLTVVLLSLAVISIVRIQESNEHLLRTALDSQITLLKGTLSEVTSSINRLSSSDYVRTWAASTVGEPSYYYNALKSYQAVGDESTYHDYLDFQLSLTTPDEMSFVITPAGTTAKERISFPSSDYLSAGIYPSFSEKQLSFVTERRLSKTTALFLVQIDLPDELVDNESLFFAIIDRNGTLCSTDNITNEIPQENLYMEEFSTHTLRGFSEAFPDLGFSIVYGYKIPKFTGVEVLILLALFALILASFFAMKTITSKLYEPVDDVLKKVPKSSGDDEFEAIVSTCRRIEILSLELDKAHEEQMMLSEQQKYRALIRGVPCQKDRNDDSAFFSLALIAFEEDEARKDILFAQLDTLSKEVSHMHFIRTGSETAVMISKQDNKEEAENTIARIIKAFIRMNGNTINFVTAVPDTIQGSDRIGAGYRRAVELLSNRYRLRGKTIIREEDVKGVSLGVAFSLQDEKRLINALLANSEEALKIYDEIVSVNLQKDRGLKQDELLSFSYSMVSLLMRYFQELKSTPEDILGEGIDWKELYRIQDSEKILRDVRDVLSRVLARSREKDESEGSRILRGMKDYINSNYMNNIMLQDLATEFNRTPKYCSQLFGEGSGDGFKNYLNKLRIEKACEMIRKEPDIKISSLSTAVGFQSVNTFIRVFDKYVGVTPKVYAERLLD